MRSLIALALALAAVSVPGAHAQQTTGSASPPECTCLADLDTLATKLQRNYVAWPIEYAGTAREREFQEVLASLRARAQNTSDSECIFVLRALTDWFHDGHLFVFELPSISPERAKELAASVERRSISEAEVRADLGRRARTLDPIEGIWYTGGYRMAVVPDRAHGKRRYVGVILSSDSALWKAGDVKATFERLDDGAYRTVMRADDHSLRHMDASMYRNILLATTPVVWGREFPLSASEAGTLDPKDPTRPTLRLVGTDAVVISVPSHDPSYRTVLDSMVKTHADVLRARPLLVIDVRGDLGGGSLTTSPLVPLFVSSTMRSPIGPIGTSTVLSSPDNIRYFQRGWNPDSVQQRMRASPGVLMPLLRNETLGMPFPTDSVQPLPRRVAVMMDRGVASAGEAFLLQAYRSTKVTLFGEPSYGMIDYQSVNVVALACRPRGILFGYPMIAAARDLPKNGLNAKGIQPDVRIPGSTRDPVGWVLDSLRKM